MQRAVHESAPNSFSRPPWTTTGINSGRGVRRTGAPQPTQENCTL